MRCRSSSAGPCPTSAMGSKPSQRRILTAMLDLGLTPGGSTSKCAGIVGETMKRYHPHGDNSIYPTLARMAQWWNMRHLLITGQGNFGSIHGLPPAAMRYTEAKLSPVAAEMLEDIEARHRRLPAQLRREVPGTPRPSRQVSQPSRQRLGRDRRRHGDLDPAAQPRRGLRRRRRLYRQSRHRPRRTDRDHPRRQTSPPAAPSAAAGGSARRIGPAEAG